MPIKNKKNFMRIRFHLLGAVSLLARLAAAQSFEPFGLQDKTVAAMTYYGGSLYAATENDGVYRRFLGAPDSDWVHLGIPAKNLTTIFAFHTLCPLKCWKGVLAGAALHPAQNDTSLIYFYQQRPDTCQQKGQWVAADSGIARTNLTRVTALGGIDVCHPIAPTYVTAFAATPGVIWRSEDRGKSWKPVWQTPPATILTFAMGSKKYFSPADDEIWAGGYVVNDKGIHYPLILRSTDSGLHWEDRTPPALVYDECRALALHPTDTSLVHAAFTYSLLKSNDAGKTWRATNFTETAVSFHALALNPQQPAHLLAGGTMTHVGVAQLYESKDAGANWRQVFPVNRLVNVNSLVFDPANGRQIYLATSRNGVYRYPRLAVGVAEEKAALKSFQLAANFPNPLKLAENAALTFSLDLPAADRVAFRLFNVLGQEMGVWKFSARAGAQNFSLPIHATILTGGVYFMQVEWRGQRATQKVTVIR